MGRETSSRRPAGQNSRPGAPPRDPARSCGWRGWRYTCPASGRWRVSKFDAAREEREEQPERRQTPLDRRHPDRSSHVRRDVPSDATTGDAHARANAGRIRGSAGRVPRKSRRARALSPSRSRATRTSNWCRRQRLFAKARSSVFSEFRSSSVSQILFITAPFGQHSRNSEAGALPPPEPVGRHSSSARAASASERQHPAARLARRGVAPHFAFLSSVEAVRTPTASADFFHGVAHSCHLAASSRPSGSSNRARARVGFTLLGGAVGFYVEDKVEAYYKEQRFRHFEKVVLEKHRARSDDRALLVQVSDQRVCVSVRRAVAARRAASASAPRRRRLAPGASLGLRPQRDLRPRRLRDAASTRAPSSRVRPAAPPRPPPPAPRRARRRGPSPWRASIATSSARPPRRTPRAAPRTPRGRTARARRRHRVPRQLLRRRRARAPPRARPSTRRPSRPRSPLASADGRGRAPSPGAPSSPASLAPRRAPPPPPRRARSRRHERRLDACLGARRADRPRGARRPPAPSPPPARSSRACAPPRSFSRASKHLQPRALLLGPTSSSATPERAASASASSSASIAWWTRRADAERGGRLRLAARALLRLDARPLLRLAARQLLRLLPLALLLLAARALLRLALRRLLASRFAFCSALIFSRTCRDSSSRRLRSASLRAFSSASRRLLLALARCAPPPPPSAPSPPPRASRGAPAAASRARAEARFSSRLSPRYGGVKKPRAAAPPPPRAP